MNDRFPTRLFYFACIVLQQVFQDNAPPGQLSIPSSERALIKNEEVFGKLLNSKLTARFGILR